MRCLTRLRYQALDASKPEGFAALADKIGDISGGLSICSEPHPSCSNRRSRGCTRRGWPVKMCKANGLEKPLGNDLACQLRSTMP